METKPVAGHILAELEEMGSEERRIKTASYAPTSQRVVGVTNPGMRRLIKELKKQYAEWSSVEWIGLCKELVRMSVFECQVVAYEIIAGSKIILENLEYKDVEDLYKNLDNWASVDHFSVGIFGVLWKNGVVSDEKIDELVDSGNVWDRRVGVVSTVALNTRSRGGTGDASRTLSVCEKVVDDPHPMIRKALSWSLRSLVRWDRDAVGGFLEKHRDSMSKSVIREVEHKLKHGTKN